MLATAIFLVYTLFLDDNDIFTIISNSNKLGKLTIDTEMMKKDLIKTTSTLDKLEYLSEVEKFAREEKLFKKKDEDVYVIFYEKLN